MEYENNHENIKRTYQKLKLYHFTSRYHIENIKKEGLTKGAIPEFSGGKLYEIRNYQWLTKNKGWNSQGWERPSEKLNYRRNEYRITIVIPKQHRAPLIKWTEFIKKYKLNIADELNAFGGSDYWYLFHGTVKPKWFRNIEKNPQYDF